MTALTPRQLEVLGWLAKGKSAAVTAATMGLSVWTVKEHLEGARERLEARNSTHAVAVAIRNGWIQ